jgi:hypothetical protein
MQDQEQKSPYIVGMQISRDNSTGDNEGKYLAVVTSGNRFHGTFAFGTDPETACRTLAEMIVETLDKADDYDLTRKNGVAVTVDLRYLFTLDELGVTSTSED